LLPVLGGSWCTRAELIAYGVRPLHLLPGLPLALGRSSTSTGTL
jgi:hypothetical protein